MSFKLAGLLNPAPSSRPLSPRLHLTPHEDPLESWPHHTHPEMDPPLADDHSTQRGKPLQSLDIDPDTAPIQPPAPPTEPPSFPISQLTIASLAISKETPTKSVDQKELVSPTPTPAQPHYDILPPGTRFEPQTETPFPVNGPWADSASAAGGANPSTINSHQDTAHDGSVQVRAASLSIGIEIADISNMGYKVPEQKAAAQAVQDEEESSVDQLHAGLGLPGNDAPKSVKRPHRAPNAKPSEGSSDKRFLCYICIKLFTRRRSVRDHIKKIHNLNHFDMARAIEVSVAPETGESLIPLTELVKTLLVPLNHHQSPAAASHPPSRASSVDTNAFSTPAAIAGKKRGAAEMGPVQTTASKKRGTAKAKPLNLNRKVRSGTDTITGSPTAFRSPSGTPVSLRANKTPVVARVRGQPSASFASSPAPSDRASAAAVSDDEGGDDREQMQGGVDIGEEAEASDGSEAFCICRKGDNHTWMIGCDGGCEDWFHGKCVEIAERDGDLIDKYMCPSCEDQGQGQTTWKRMCRRSECRRPARVLALPPSKYCSDECRKRFWVGITKRSDANALVSGDGLRVTGSAVQQLRQDRKKFGIGKTSLTRSSTGLHGNKCISLAEDMLSSDEDEPPLPTRGGPLSVGDVKLILTQAGTVEKIRQLGQKPPTPPDSSDTEAEIGTLNSRAAVDEVKSEALPFESRHHDSQFIYSADERLSLSRISAQQRRLNDELQLLSDQTKVLGMIKTRSAAIVEAMHVPKAKNICGFDARLSWSAAEFQEWRASRAGRTALTAEEIGDPAPIPTKDEAVVKIEKQEGEEDHVFTGQKKHVDGDDDDGDDVKLNLDQDAEEGEDNDDGRTRHRAICIRSKCPRHRDWRRLLASEYKFEEEGCRKQIRRLDGQARSVRDMAAMRALCEQT